MIEYPLPSSGNGNGPTRTGKPLNNQHVLDMVAVGLQAKVIVAKVERSPGNFETSPEVMKELKAAGVPDSVILAMVKAS